MKLQHTKSIFRRLRGQGMSEYLVIVGMIAVAGIVVSGLLGETVRSSFGSMALSLAGKDSTTQRGVADTTAALTATKSAVDANIGNTISEYGGTAR